ncbi:MAG TPA: tetratricopeptide repeat protein, partial [Lacipirellulaceae bacterium]
MSKTDGSAEESLARVEHALSLLYKGEADAAKRIFDEVLITAPACARAVCGRGSALRALGRAQQAIEDYDAALSIQPDYARALFNRGLARFELGDTDGALADLDVAISKGPEPGFYYHRGECYFRLKRFEEARNDFTTCIELDPDAQIWAYIQRGFSFSELGLHKEAACDFEAAIQRNPSEASLYIYAAHALCCLENYDKAISMLDKAIEIKGDDDLYYRRGHALYLNNDFESAIRDFDKALKTNCRPEMYLWRGCAWLRLRDYEAAIADLSDAIALDDSSCEALTWRGDA